MFDPMHLSPHSYHERQARGSEIVFVNRLVELGVRRRWQKLLQCRLRVTFVSVAFFKTRSQKLKMHLFAQI